MQWHPVGFDSNNNQILAFGGTKVPLPIKVRNINNVRYFRYNFLTKLTLEDRSFACRRESRFG